MAIRIDTESAKANPKRLGVEDLNFVTISDILSILEPIGIRSKAAVRKLADEGRIRVRYPFPSDREKAQKMHPRYCLEDAKKIRRSELRGGD